MRAGRGLWVVTLNFEMVARGLRDRSYAELIGQADSWIADGAPISWWLSCFHRIRAPRVAGVDLLARLLSESRGNRIVLLGGTETRKLVDQLNLEKQNILVIDGTVAMSGLSAAELRLIKDFSPHFVAVALGVPKQDIVSRALRREVPGAVILGVGGAFDFISRTKARAPLWMQRSGLEWLHRLITEPRRLARRYLIEYPVGFLRLGLFALKKHACRLKK